MSKIWNSCKKQLKKQLNLQTYSLWIHPLSAQNTTIQGVENITLYAPNEAVFKFVKNNLQKEIIKTAQNIDATATITIKQKTKNTPTKTISTHLDGEFCFENMIEGDANMFPLSVAKEVAKHILNPTYNPLIIYGDSGLGKTHLMQAIGNYAFKHNKGLKIIYMPLMDFVKNITSGIRHNNIEKVKNYYQNADLLLVDDIHLIADKEKSQEEFFHIFNFLFNDKKQIVFTCDQIPNNLKGVEKRLKTRFSSGMSVQIKPPELEMRAAILIYKASLAKINITLSEELALYIANNIKSNVRDLEGALLKLKAYVNFLKTTEVTKSVVDEALKDIIKPQKSNVDIFDIQKTIAKFFNITTSDLTSNSRKQNLVNARQMAIFLSCEFTNLSLIKIGKNFGNRDHSTILYSKTKFKEKITKNNEIKQQYEELLTKLLTL
jgi:chromosomal replication initiator protein